MVPQKLFLKVIHIYLEISNINKQRFDDCKNVGKMCDSKARFWETLQIYMK